MLHEVPVLVANVAVTQLTSSALVVYLIQLLKSAKWFPLLQDGKKWANRIASIIGAALTALAINYAWTWDPATRLFSFSITIPTLTVFLVALFHWAQQFAINELIYQVTANKPAAPVAQKGTS